LEQDLTADLTITRALCFDETMARRICAMLGQGPSLVEIGGAIPAGWHFPLLGCETARDDLRADGFPGLGVPMPDLGLPRVVAAGRSVQFNRPLKLGAGLVRKSEISSIKQKETANGPLAIVTVTHEILETEAPRSAPPAVFEEQTYVLVSSPYAAPAAASAAQLPSNIIKTITPDETLLFQFSALSFNSHRIHLDRDYARSAEGYPDLVVNGGIVTLLMTELARLELGRDLRSLTLRNKAPLFCNRPFHLAVEQADSVLRILAIDHEGQLAAEMEAISDDI
jgi:3-methylfumaryl-CoA hydratase